LAVQSSGMSWLHFRDGRLAEGWGSVDQSGLIHAVTTF